LSEINRKCKECGAFVKDTHEGVPFTDGTAMCMNCFTEDYKHIGSKVMEALERGGLFDEEIETSDEQWFDDPEWIELNRGEPFEVAWDSIEKEWSPNWRDEASKLPLHQLDEYLDLDLGEGTELRTYEHPSNPNFVIKRPISLNRRPPTSYGRSKDPELDRLKELVELGSIEMNSIERLPYWDALESLGYPVVSSKYFGSDQRELGNYFVQPRMSLDEKLIPHKVADWKENHEFIEGIIANNNRGKKIANPMKDPAFAAASRESQIIDEILTNAVGDRHGGNFGLDQKGNERMFDLQMHFGDGIGEWDSEEMQQRQQTLNQYGIQIPASRMLNAITDEMVEIDPYVGNYRAYLERLEPHSDNPKYVEVDGKAKWMEGY